MILWIRQLWAGQDPTPVSVNIPPDMLLSPQRVLCRTILSCLFLSWGVLFQTRAWTGPYSVVREGLLPWISRVRRGWRTLCWNLWGWGVRRRQVCTMFHLVVVTIGWRCHWKRKETSIRHLANSVYCVLASELETLWQDYYNNLRLKFFFKSGWGHICMKGRVL